MDGSISSKSEKRRSGFFGLGGKKDKKQEKDHKEEVSLYNTPRVRVRRKAT